ncbi:MAG: transporter, partial [Bacteroidales bacterium]
KESFLFNTKLQMTQVTEEIQKWNAMIVSDQEIVRLRTSLKQAAQTKYNNGVISMNTLLKAINEETTALQNQSLHNIQRLMSLYQYQIITGN